MKEPQSLSFKRSILIRMASLIGLAIILTGLIFWFYFLNEPEAGFFGFLFVRPMVFLVSVVVISLVLLTIFGLVGRVIWLGAALGIVAVILLAINSVKMTSRSVPLLPEDFRLFFEASQVASVVPIATVILALVLIVAIVVAARLAQRYVSRYYQIEPYSVRQRGVLLLIGMVSLFGLLSLHSWIKKPDWYFRPNPLLGARILTWNQRLNYMENGPVVGFFYNIGKPPIIKPDDYSEETIAQLVTKYAVDLATDVDMSESDEVDIIFVLSESLTDPLLFQDYYPLRRDPIPFIRQLMDKYPSTWLNVSEYGGGTANVEFEALTGFSSVFDHGTSFYNASLAKRPDFPSLVWNLKRRGYQTGALHAYHAEMYKRNIVYPNLGFDDFVGLERMKHTDKLERNPYVSDQAIFRELLERLDQNPDQPKFEFVITMQNHVPYDALYDLGERFQVQDGEEKHWFLENYLRGLEYTDQAVQELITALDHRQRKTLVFFGGDHLPGYGVFQQVKDQDPDLSQKVPFIIYANFDLPIASLDELSPNYMPHELAKILGWQSSPFSNLLAQLRAKVPVLTVTSYGELQSSSDQVTQELLRDYRLIEYDLLAGRQYAVKRDFFASR